MQVDVFNRRTVSAMEPQADTCLISIWSLIALGTHFYDEAPLNLEGWKDVLRLEFDDVTLNEQKVMILNPLMRGDTDSFETTPFSEEHAGQVLDFIDKHHGEPFIVHCDAGISRSAAVASFMEIYHGYDAKYHQTGDDRHRNIHVFNLLRRALMARQTD